MAADVHWWLGDENATPTSAAKRYVVWRWSVDRSPGVASATTPPRTGRRTAARLICARTLLEQGSHLPVATDASIEIKPAIEPTAHHLIVQGE
jgi:hypothetical protein